MAAKLGITNVRSHLEGLFPGGLALQSAFVATGLTEQVHNSFPSPLSKICAISTLCCEASLSIASNASNRDNLPPVCLLGATMHSMKERCALHLGGCGCGGGTGQ